MIECPEHEWEPLTGWVGRYRCVNCRVLAFKPLTRGAVERGEKMRVYICKKPKCINPAVTHKGGRQLCKEHADSDR